MKRTILAIVLTILVLAGCIGCAVPEQSEREHKGASLTIMSWNVHNLFNGEDDGFEYAQFLQSAGWSHEKYLGRLNTITTAISDLHRQPDIILLQEIESLAVLEDLASLLPAGFLWSHFAGNYGAATGVGILSRLPIADNGNTVRAHSITVGNETSPRPVLEVRIDGSPGTGTTDESFVIFVCHWKSKLGGEDKTESLRRASARVILRRIRELWEQEPELGVIIAGDLNLNHDEFYKRGSNSITALMPDDLHASRSTFAGEAAQNQNDFLILSGNKPPVPVYFNKENIVFFSPWTGGDLENGSYYYMYNWETIDHFLLTYHFFNNKGWEYEQAYVVNYQPFANANGIPLGYNEKTGNGLSDHLPLMVTFLKRQFLHQVN